MDLSKGLYVENYNFLIPWGILELEMVIHGDRVFGKRKSDNYFWTVDGIEITIHCDERFVAAYWYEIVNPFIR